MKRFKNTLAWSLTIIFLLNILMVVPVSARNTSTQSPTATPPAGTIINDKVLSNLGVKPQIPKIAQDAIDRGVKPAALERVTWTLDQNVELLNDEAIQSIKSNVNNGVVDVSHLSGIRPENGKIYVDKISGASLQFVEGKDNKTYLFTTEQDSLVKEIDIPDQSVRLNDANISSQNENVVINRITTFSTSDNPPSMYEIKFNKDVSVSGVDNTKNTVGVKLSGNLFINAPTMDAKYTKWDGYKFIYHAGERAEVSAELYADVKKEVKVPLLGFDIPSDICGVTIGVFLVIGVDGKITLDYSFEQNYDITAGVQGGTCYYVPTSLDGVLEQNFGFDTDGVNVTGEIKGDLYISAEVALKILGKVSIDINVKLGMLLDVKFDTGVADSFKAKAEGYFSINAKVKIFSKDWKKELYSYHFSLFDKTQKPKSVYVISINEACAYRDIIKGQVEIQTAPDTKVPYVGALTLSVTRPGGTDYETIDVDTTDSNGYFTANYNLVSGSKVAVKLPDSVNLWSEPVMARFPFSNVVIKEADYCKGVIAGYISPDDKNTLFYTGPVKICLIDRNNIPIAASKALTVPVNQTILQQVNCTNGTFRSTIKNLDPYDMVFAYIDYDGFRVSSNCTETEGLQLNVTGDYEQQPDKLLTEGRTIVLGGSYYANKTINRNKGSGIVEPTGEIKYKVIITYPHGETSNNTIEKEWTLPLSKTAGGAITASTGPWMLDLPPIQADQLRPSSPLLLLRGDLSVQYHVQEIIEYFYKGKRIEISNEALTCDYEKAEEGIKLPNILGNKINVSPWDNTQIVNPLQNIINPRINPELNLGNFLFGLNNDANNSVVPYSANTGNNNGTTDTASRQSSPNFSCNVQIKIYESASDRTPETLNWNLKVRGSNIKITSGNTSVLLLRDLKRKVYLNNELHTVTSARYDGDDYLPELSGIKFRPQKPQTINGQKCNVYEQKGSNTLLRICELKGKGVPISVVLTTNGAKIEMVFSNYVYNKVTAKDMSY